MGKTNNTRGWTDLTIGELKSILESGDTPKDLNWDSLPQHPSFERIFRVRDNPKKIAAILLDSKGEKSPPVEAKPRVTKYQPALSQEYRDKRLALKREELEMQKAKSKNQTVMFEKILQIETDVHTVKKLLKSVLDILREAQARSRRV